MIDSYNPLYNEDVVSTTAINLFSTNLCLLSSLKRIRMILCRQNRKDRGHATIYDYNHHQAQKGSLLRRGSSYEGRDEQIYMIRTMEFFRRANYMYCL
jgi:hypothetical protein